MKFIPKASKPFCSLKNRPDHKEDLVKTDAATSVARFSTTNNPRNSQTEPYFHTSTYCEETNSPAETRPVLFLLPSHTSTYCTSYILQWVSPIQPSDVKWPSALSIPWHHRERKNNNDYLYHPSDLRNFNRTLQKQLTEAALPNNQCTTRLS